VQLNDLKQDICKFVLDYKNNNIHLHLAGNNVEIDPKIYAVFENVCIIIQLIEDPYSFYLTEKVEELIINRVMKCKRGLTQTEYNFENHDFRGDLMQFDYDELDLNIKKTQEEMDNEKLKSALENKPNVNQEKENTFETIYFNENNEVKQRSKTTK